MTEAFPLAWPAHVARTPAAQRKRAKFSTRKEVRRTYGDGYFHQSQQLSVAEALKRLQAEVERLTDASGRRPRGVVLSSNVELRLDGLPYSNRRDPDDPGVALYFDFRGKPYCMPCDKWDRVADNIAAIAGHIDATRTIERYGVGTVEAAFTGFLYLPPPSWWTDLGLKAKPATLADAEAAWRRVVREHHPDVGGDTNTAARANQAIADARKEMAGG